MAAWLFKCTGIQTTSWREGTVSVGILLLFHVQEIINLQREKTYFRSQFSWFQSTIVYIALGAVARKHIMIKNVCQIKNKIRRKGEKRRKEWPHPGDSTILRLPFSQGSPTSHQCHAGDQAFATWAFGRHSGCNPQLSLAVDSIHTPSLLSEILGL